MKHETQSSTFQELAFQELNDSMKPLTRSELFKANPVFQELFTQYVAHENVQERNSPSAPTLVPIHAGISLPGNEVFTEENRSWHGVFHMDSSLENPTLETSGFPSQLMYPPGTRIDTALICWDEKGDFVMSSSAVFLKRKEADSTPLPPLFTDETGTLIVPPGGVVIKRGEPDPLPLLQINQRWHNPDHVCSGPFSSSKKNFASPIEWFKSLEEFSYGIIKVTVPDTRSYAERTRVALQATLDKIEGTAADKILCLQRILKVTYNFRYELSIRDRYQQACVALREYKRQVYAFLHIDPHIDLDDPEQVYAFARRGHIMKRLQMKVNILNWILQKTPEAERCLGEPVNILKGGRIGLWYEEPIVGVLCPMLAVPVNKKIYYKPRVFPKIAEVPSELKEVHVTIRGGATICLNL